MLGTEIPLRRILACTVFFICGSNNFFLSHFCSIKIFCGAAHIASIFNQFCVLYMLSIGTQYRFGVGFVTETLLQLLQEYNTIYGQKMPFFLFISIYQA